MIFTDEEFVLSGICNFPEFLGKPLLDLEEAAIFLISSAALQTEESFISVFALSCLCF